MSTTDDPNGAGAQPPAPTPETRQPPVDTKTPHRRAVENAEFGAMMHRMLKAWGQRVAAGDTYDLAELVEFQRSVEQTIHDAIQHARATDKRVGREAAWSWSAIGDALGTTRQAAQKRYGA